MNHVNVYYYTQLCPLVHKGLLCQSKVTNTMVVFFSVKVTKRVYVTKLLYKNGPLNHRVPLPTIYTPTLVTVSEGVNSTKYAI